MANNRMRPIHPGEVLQANSSSPGDKRQCVSVALPHAGPEDQRHRPRSAERVTPDAALRLARYFDTTAQYWLQPAKPPSDLEAGGKRSAGRKIAEEVRPDARAARILFACSGAGASSAPLGADVPRVQKGSLATERGGGI